MIELTATTLNLIYEEIEIYDKAGYDSESHGDAESAVYVTAKMWGDCDSWEACQSAGATPVNAEPMEWIPLHVLYRESRIEADDFDAELEQHSETTIETTNTAKLFFPDKQLVNGQTYFVTLEFAVEVSAFAHACYGDTYVSMYAEAELGPHIIDAQIIKHGDFGSCSWLDPDIKGCGMFDIVSGDSPNCN
jgi:hypothetical protein